VSLVTILLASFNGAEFLRQQLESIALQTHNDWRLIVSDDGSSDATRDIVESFGKTRPNPLQVQLIEGPKLGESSANFLHLLRHIPEEDTMVAFCDQDDVWLPNKLEQAVAKLMTAKRGQPALYGSRTKIADQNLTETGLSPLFQGPFEFRNALVQSFAGGNTMLMTPSAAKIAKVAAQSVEKVVTHDWFMYQLINRQHAGNIIGSNAGALAKLRRIVGLFSGRYRRWNQINLAALSACSNALSPSTAALCEDMQTLRQLRGLRAIKKLNEMKLFRHTYSGQLALYVGAFWGKL